IGHLVLLTARLDDSVHRRTAPKLEGRSAGLARPAAADVTTCAASHLPGYGSVSRRVKPGLPPLNPQAPLRAGPRDGRPPDGLGGAGTRRWAPAGAPPR